MVIDFHTHAFPDKIAARAVETLSACSGGAVPLHNGTVASLSAYVRKSGAEKAVLLNIATNPRQQKSVNDFAISLLGNDTVIPFGSVHPDSPDVLEELERLKESGILGIKLHPDYQHFFADEDRMCKIYEKAAELGLVTVFHAGVDIGYPSPVHCTPERLLRILPIFGDTPVVAAHWGGYLLWERALETLAGTNVYLDTAFSAGKMPPDYARALVEAHSAEKILLGSDLPWSGTDREIAFIRSLGLSEMQTAQILGKNAKKILHI